MATAPQNKTYGPVTPVLSYKALNHSSGTKPILSLPACSGTLTGGKLAKSRSGASCGNLLTSLVAGAADAVFLALVVTAL